MEDNMVEIHTTNTDNPEIKEGKTNIIVVLEKDYADFRRLFLKAKINKDNYNEKMTEIMDYFDKKNSI